MEPCDEEDEGQLFVFDPVSAYIHPDPSRSWCLDYAGPSVDSKVVVVCIVPVWHRLVLHPRPALRLAFAPYCFFPTGVQSFTGPLL